VKIERAVWIFVIALTALRLLLLETTDLQFDEAHYWMWSERLAPAYFSKGPGVALAMRFSALIFGATEFGVRFFSPLLGAGTSLLLFYLARSFFDARAGLWAVIAVNVTPIFNIGNFVMTIDPLSLFFWVAAMFSFWQVVERSPRFSFHWLGVGACIGLGFLCKYTNALELVSVVMVLALIPKLRTEFRRPGFYLMLVVVIACGIPPFLWNQQHAWITLAHLKSRGGIEGSLGIHPLEFLAFLAEHLLVYSPLIFLGIVIAVSALWRRSWQQPRRLFLMWFGLPVFAFYALLSINKAAAPNWDALAFPGFGLLAIAFWRDRLPASRLWRTTAGASLAIGLLMSVLALDSDILRSAGIPISRRDPADGMRGWKGATNALESVRHEVEAQTGEEFFLIADSRDRASEISFYLHNKQIEGVNHPPCYLLESQAIENQFSFWPRYDEFVARDVASAPAPEDQTYTEETGVNLFTGRGALFVQEAGHKNAPHNIRAAFASADRIATIEVRRFGKPMRAWDVFLCRNYRTLPL
jgi:4-amino-4-deoxy-L-arabinose transferase-like glycosyltransferase